jgi:hypothetical protein
VLDPIASIVLPRSSLIIPDAPHQRETDYCTELVVVLDNQRQGGLAMRRRRKNYGYGASAWREGIPNPTMGTRVATGRIFRGKAAGLVPQPTKRASTVRAPVAIGRPNLVGLSSHCNSGQSFSYADGHKDPRESLKPARVGLAAKSVQNACAEISDVT